MYLQSTVRCCTITRSGSLELSLPSDTPTKQASATWIDVMGSDRMGYVRRDRKGWNDESKWVNINRSALSQQPSKVIAMESGNGATGDSTAQQNLAYTVVPRV